MRAAVGVGGPEQGGAYGPVDGGPVRNSRAGVAEDGGAVERHGGKVGTEVSVGGGDADGLAGFQAVAEEGGDHAAARPAGVHLLELEEGLVFQLRGGDGHRGAASKFKPNVDLSQANALDFSPLIPEWQRHSGSPQP